MATPDPESFGLLGKVLGAATAVLVPVWGFVKLWDKKADKSAVKAGFEEVREELTRQRDVQAKIFDHIRESDQKGEERHRELLMHLVKKGD